MRITIRRLGMAAALTATLLVPFGASAAQAKGKPAATTPDWKFVWGDTFSGPLDPQKWGAIEGTNTNIGTDNVFASFDSTTSNDHLDLKAEKRQYGSKSYTSGEVWTKGRFTFTYGKIDVVAKAPAFGTGIWDALWLQGAVSSAWPGPGGNEIDFAEMWNDPSVVNNALHYADTPNGPDLGQNQGCTGASAYHSPTPLSDAFHTYSLVWQPGPKLSYYVDGVKTCEADPVGNYFNTPMFIVMDTAIGASWIGHPDASVPFPQDFQIDAVRVYQDQSLS